MKEPLKGKALKSIHNTIDCDIYKDKDIKSAVEWLKGRMLKIDPNCTMDWDLINVLKMIDEAFEDVVNQK